MKKFRPAPQLTAQMQPSQRLVRLNDSEVAASVNSMSKRLSADKNFAEHMLRTAGIITAKGNLTKRFGG
jgi:hypothetical protein